MKQPTSPREDSRVSTSIRRKLILVGVGVFLACIVLEVFARIIMPAPLPWLYPQVMFVADEELIFRLKPNHSSFTADKRVDVNHLGLRSPRSSYAKTDDVARLHS